MQFTVEKDTIINCKDILIIMQNISLTVVLIRKLETGILLQVRSGTSVGSGEWSDLVNGTAMEISTLNT